MPETAALCVGIARYSINVAPLEFAEREASAVHRELCSRHVRSVLLTGIRATRERVRAALAEIASSTKDGDLVLFYFTGHGGQSADGVPAGEPGFSEYLLLDDGPWTDSELALTLRELRGRRVLLVLDACHSAGMADSLAAADLGRAPNGEDWVQLIASAASGEFSRGIAGRGSYLTSAFIDALRSPVLPDRYEAFFRAIEAAIPSTSRPVFRSSSPAAAALPVRIGDEPPLLSDDDVQAHVLFGFPRHEHVALLFFTIGDVAAFKTSLRSGALAPTSAARYGDSAATRRPVRALSFTHAGLRRLSAPEIDRVGKYSQEPLFRPRVFGENKTESASGPAAGSGPHGLPSGGGTYVVPDAYDTTPSFEAGMDDRSVRVLGDPWKGPGSWKHWKLKSTFVAPVHGLLLVGAGSEAELSAAVEELRSVPGLSFRREDGYSPADHREHFGFRDGIAQPGIAVRRASAPSGPRLLPSSATSVFPKSALLLPNGEGAAAPGAALPHWARNGSFLVYRRLSQEVGRFREAMRAAGESSGRRPSDVAALLIGRRRDGTSLEDGPLGARAEAAELDAFEYTRGRCPVFAHARRANPRDARKADGVPLFRRGLLFGRKLAPDEADDGAERGLHFLCYQASIEHQFEVVSRWMNDPHFPEANAGVDGLLGRKPTELHPAPREYQIGGARLAITEFVYPSGGAYLFAPSLSGLLELGEG